MVLHIPKAAALADPMATNIAPTRAIITATADK